MQGPTHPRLHIRDRADAHKLFEAVRLGLLPAVTRRLNDAERVAHIKSGSVFVWEQSDKPMGLKRWTENLHWSASRMREPFLFYDEKQPITERGTSPSREHYRFVSEAGSRLQRPSPSMSHLDRSAACPPAGLVKQAYSSWVLVAPNQPPKKWHITAYFTYKDLPYLPNIDYIPSINNIHVPEGMYRSGKAKFKPTVSESNTPYNNSNAKAVTKFWKSPSPVPLPSSPELSSNESDCSYSLPSTDSDRFPYRRSHSPHLPPIQCVDLGPLDHSNMHMRMVDGRSPEDARLIRLLNSRHTS